jgi:hypothetical protein
MDYPRRKRKSKSSDGKSSDERLELKLAEYSAPFGEELPWRIGREEPQLVDISRAYRPERGRLH